MKKTITRSILAAAIALAFGSAALAQVTLPYTETFDRCTNGFLPEGWTANDLDGDGNNWMTNNFPSGDPAGHGNSQRCAMSASWWNGALTPKNALISPNVTGVKSIRYWVSASNPSDFAEHYTVYATSKDDPSENDWAEIFSETLTAEAGAQNMVDNSKYQYREMNVPEGTKYISFMHHDCTNQLFLRIDDITFSNRFLGEPITLPYTETFETCTGGSLPEGWTANDMDGDGYNWTTNNFASGNPAGHGNSQRCAMSRSWWNQANLTPKNNLISPMLTGVKSISYWVSASNPDDFAEHYTVYATSKDDPSENDWTEVFSETLTEEAGANTASDNSKYQYREMNVPEGTKYISFMHHDCTGQFALRIDDITFSNKALASITLPYTETFESCSGGALPEGWTVNDMDGDGNNWATNNFENGDPACGYGDSQRCALSASYVGGLGPVTPKNALISPKVTGVKSLNYWVSASSASDFAEHYKVYASSKDASTNLDDYTLLFEETLTEEAGATAGGDNSKYQYREMNVPLDTKHILFLHSDCTGKFFLRIDDITFSDKPTSIQGIEAEQLRLYAKAGELCIETSTAAARINVFALDGRRVADQMSVSGLNTIALERGYYLVQVGSFTGKVYVP